MQFQLYDQQTTSQRKSLLPKSPSAHNMEAQMVETSLFDIYLCDNCDAELYSLAAYTEHEKTCSATSADHDSDDDDVIFIESENCSPARTDQGDFLSNLGLYNASLPQTNSGGGAASRRRVNHYYTDIFSPEKQLRHLPSRVRAAAALTKCHMIPISSPCGVKMFQQSKNIVTKEYQAERLDRLERFCGAPPISGGYDLPRFMVGKNRTAANPNVNFRKPEEDYHYHNYKFPRRQLSTKLRRSHFMFLNSLLLKSWRPLSVRTKRLSNTDIDMIKAKLRQAAHRFSLAAHKPTKPDVVEFIDLCSSDDDDEPPVNTNVYPASATVDEETTNLSGGSEVDENQIQKVNGTVITVPVGTSTLFSGSQQLTNNSMIQPLRPSVFLFSNTFNQKNGSTFFQQEQITSATSTKATTINSWLNSGQPTARKSTGAHQIQQFTTTTTIRTITNIGNVAT